MPRAEFHLQLRLCSSRGIIVPALSLFRSQDGVVSVGSEGRNLAYADSRFGV